MLQIKDLACTALRKVKGAKKKHTAGQLKKEGALEELLRHDEGYRVLKTIRSSPPYWEAKQKDIFSMMRQIGKPTFFATFSAIFIANEVFPILGLPAITIKSSS